MFVSRFVRKISKLQYYTSHEIRRRYAQSADTLRLRIVQLNENSCKTYCLSCPKSKEAIIVDPLKENLSLYLAFIAYNGYRIKYVADSHSHADHFTAAFRMKQLFPEIQYVMHNNSPSPRIDFHLHDQQILKIGNCDLKVLHTPGHTPDSISLYTGEAVLTGDTLFIGGTGRTDFAGGDPGQSYDSIVNQLFTLPDETLVYPSHDYRHNSVSTIGQEKRQNPRIANKTREQYINIMNNLGLPLPEKIMEALQINTSAIDDNSLKLPTYTQLNQVKQLEPETVNSLLHHQEQPVLILDVREVEEFKSKSLPPIAGSINIPLKELHTRVGEIEQFKNRKVLCICRAGVRSTTASSVLTALDFKDVYSMKGGLLSWRETYRL
eukprot:TRINITY_DN9059_c0_g1_i1.p1 TRINITY_DN9059_c0_g1~~TRINITY_DN9059_c0_g1_i1.p1  ORF type:complete len:379 (-),score=40.69 TRINITY_DN9059_c0_g1_i1:46-1182(-)